MSSVRKHFSLEAANFSLFSQEGEVTSSLIPGPAWSFWLQFTKYQQRYAPMKFFISTLFRKSVWDIFIASIRLSVMLSPPKPLDRIQPNLVSGLLTQVGRARACLFLAPPQGPWGGVKRSNINNFQFQSQF